VVKTEDQLHTPQITNKDKGETLATT
jgi:hypothetical protein